MRDLSVVIPVYNNEDILPLLNRKLIESTLGRLKEIVYVNDGSIDDSLNVLTKLSEQNDFIYVINQQNLGQQKAIQNGLKKTQGELIVVMDADLQDNPMHIADMILFHKKHGFSCFIKRNGLYQGIGKMFTSMILKTIIWAMSSLHYKAGSYYLIDRFTLLKVLHLSDKCKNVYMSVLVAHASENIGYINAKREKSQKTGYNFKRRLKAGISAVRCSFECLLIKV